MAPDEKGTENGINHVEPSKKRRTFTPLFFFILWCGCIFSQSMLVSGFLNVVLSTIQVEFQMSSAKAAMFPSNYDITVAATVLIVAHFGSSHKPRTLGLGMILLATGAFLFGLAHFIYGKDNVVPADDVEGNLYLCKTGISDNAADACDDSQNIGNSGAYALLTVGSILIGLGATPVYTAGTTFCDEIFPPDKVSLYFGISYGIGAIAPAMGFILAGVFLGFYKTLGDPPEGLTVDSVGWVGAWWPGFMIAAAIGYLFGFLLLLFPAQLPECEEVKRKKLELNIQVHHELQEAPAVDAAPNIPTEKQTFCELLREMWPLLWTVLKNPVFVLVVLGSISDSLIVSAFGAWLPKIVESQFGLSSSMAAYITGAVTVPGAAGGIILSGLIVKVRRLSGLQCAKYQAWIGVICILAQLGFLIHCPSLSIDGINAPTNEVCESAAAQCASCPGSDVYEPVCVGGATTFTSPCAAACVAFSANSSEYSGCCGGDLIATVGSCDTNCPWLIPYIIVLFLIMFFTFLNNIIFLTVNLRCVKDSERIMAISLQSVAFRVFGSFPGPIILGAFIDKACLLWNEDECGQRGACQEYNNTELMKAAVVLSVVAKTIGTALYFVGWRVWARREQAGVAYSDKVRISEDKVVSNDSVTHHVGSNDVNLGDVNGDVSI